MRSTLRIFALLLFVSLIENSIDTHAQSIPVEVMFGDANYTYQHFFSKAFKENSDFGFFHTSSLYAFYESEKKPEVMTQSYITYRLLPSLRLALGTFYASGPGFRPSAAIQIMKRGNDFIFLIVPRIDIWKNPSVEVMTLVEYRPSITDRLSLYSRIQLMSNYGPDHHNRSYQNMRAGLGWGKTQFGLAFNFDHYGAETLTHRNIGFFVRHEL